MPKLTITKDTEVCMHIETGDIENTLDVFAAIFNNDIFKHCTVIVNQWGLKTRDKRNVFRMGAGGAFELVVEGPLHAMYQAAKLYDKYTFDTWGEQRKEVENLSLKNSSSYATFTLEFPEDFKAVLQ